MYLSPPASEHSTTLEEMGAMGELVNLPAGAGEPFSRAQLQELADAMTMGDVWRSVKDAPDDRSEAGMRAFYQAAKRTELIAQDVDFGAFLDRVRQEDFVAVAQASRDAKSPA